MASIMFLGYSNLVKGRILPILAKAGFTEVTIAKYEGQSWDEDYKKCGLPVTCYDSYEEGLSHFKGDLVYVSTVNSTHVTYAKKSLEAGFNTIVDKPATATYQEALDLVKKAESKNLLVGESTVYLVHPQLNSIKQIFANNGDAPKMLTVHFTMPPFKPENFRYQKSLGGGAIMDTAPYAASIARYFFNAEPEQVFCVVNEQKKEDDLDIEYSLLMQYSEGRSMIGHFGFNTEYINQVFLMGNRTNVIVNRIFTIPDTMENELVVNHLNEATTVKTPTGNNFEIYLAETLQALRSGNYEKAYNDLLSDAKVKQMIFDNIK
jgi:predicted dehydrogenase